MGDSKAGFGSMVQWTWGAGLVVDCYSARRFDADRRANPLRSLDSGGSNFRAKQHIAQEAWHGTRERGKKAAGEKAENQAG